MTARSLAAIAVQVWGAVLLVGAVTTVPAVILWPSLGLPVDGAPDLARASQLRLAIDLAARGLAGVALVAWAHRGVRFIVPDGPPLTIDVYASELSALAFALLGLYVTIDGAGDIAATVYSLVTRPALPNGERTLWYVWEPQRRAIVKAFVEIAAGVLLVYGRKGMANAWWTVRRLGIVAGDGDACPTARS